MRPLRFSDRAIALALVFTLSLPGPALAMRVENYREAAGSEELPYALAAAGMEEPKPVLIDPRDMPGFDTSRITADNHPDNFWQATAEQSWNNAVALLKHLELPFSARVVNVGSDLRPLLLPPPLRQAENLDPDKSAQIASRRIGARHLPYDTAQALAEKIFDPARPETLPEVVLLQNMEEYFRPDLWREVWTIVRPGGWLLLTRRPVAVSIGPLLQNAYAKFREATPAGPAPAEVWVVGPDKVMGSAFAIAIRKPPAAGAEESGNYLQRYKKKLAHILLIQIRQARRNGSLPFVVDLSYSPTEIHFVSAGSIPLLHLHIGIIHSDRDRAKDGIFMYHDPDRGHLLGERNALLVVLEIKKGQTVGVRNVLVEAGIGKSVKGSRFYVDLQEILAGHPQEAAFFLDQLGGYLQHHAAYFQAGFNEISRSGKNLSGETLLVGNKPAWEKVFYQIGESSQSRESYLPVVQFRELQGRELLKFLPQPAAGAEEGGETTGETDAEWKLSGEKLSGRGARDGAGSAVGPKTSRRKSSPRTPSSLRAPRGGSSQSPLGKIHTLQHNSITNTDAAANLNNQGIGFINHPDNKAAGTNSLSTSMAERAMNSRLLSEKNSARMQSILKQNISEINKYHATEAEETTVQPSSTTVVMGPSAFRQVPGLRRAVEILSQAGLERRIILLPEENLPPAELRDRLVDAATVIYSVAGPVIGYASPGDPVMAGFEELLKPGHISLVRREPLELKSFVLQILDDVGISAAGSEEAAEEILSAAGVEQAA